MKINKIDIDFFQQLLNSITLIYNYNMFWKVLGRITYFENLLSSDNSLSDIDVDFLRFIPVDIHESQIWCFNGTITHTIEEVHSIVDSLKNVSVCVCFMCVCCNFNISCLYIMWKFMSHEKQKCV